MKPMKYWLLAFGLIAALCGEARADTFSFQFGAGHSSGGMDIITDTLTGEFIANLTPDGLYYQVTSIVDGNFDGSAMSLLPPGTNLVENVFSANPFVLVPFGIGFETNGINYELFYTPVPGEDLLCDTNCSNFEEEVFSSSIQRMSSSTTPEPSTLALLGTGLLGLVGLANRRRTDANSILA